MRYNTIAEAKKAFKSALSWCKKVQNACLFKKVDIDLQFGYCDGNYRDGDLAAWTVGLDVWDYEGGMHIYATWATFIDPKEFEDGKKAVLEYLEGKGITIK